MYSVILMMAMTAAPETSNFGGRWASCHGCWSSSYSCCGCSGYSHGHYRSSCYGCGGCWSSCYGWGSCYGSSCYGSSCYGSCYGSSCYGYSCYGGASYAWPTPYYGGGGGCYGYGMPAPVYSTPGTQVVPSEILPNPKKTYLPSSPDKAQVIVHLPADAKLFANDQPTNLVSDERAFNTPTLDKGRDYQYNMSVEYTREGKTYTDRQIVKVRAGEVSTVEFADLSKAKTVSSTIKVIAPLGAKLFVENKQELPADVKEFKTPQLVAGMEYAYSFRAELTKDGKKQGQTQRVIFKAGEAVTIDFTDMDSTRTASK